MRRHFCSVLLIAAMLGGCTGVQFTSTGLSPKQMTAVSELAAGVAQIGCGGDVLVEVHARRENYTYEQNPNPLKFGRYRSDHQSSDTYECWKRKR